MKKRYIIAALIAVIAIFILDTLYKANVFKTYKTAGNLQAEFTESPAGLEDITIDQKNGYAYVSSHNRREKSSRGDLYLYKIGDSTFNFINLTANFPKQDFRPHGISLFTENDSTKFLFVISHGNDDVNSVERFKIAGDSIEHLNTFISPTFLSPNDIHGISATEFYVTNDHDDTKGLLRTVYDFLKIGTGSVVFFDGNSGKTLVTGIPYANGIHTSKDGKKLFVASTNVNKLLVYNIKDDKTLEDEAVHDTGVGVDNIELDNAGSLYIGCHPQLLKFLAHSKDSTKLSPTVVLKLTYDEESKSFNQKTIYTDDGSNLSGGSVAAIYKKPTGEEVILLGSVFERKLMILK